MWYSLRHNLGQSIEETEDISQARDQLRHKYIETTKLTYGESTIESRRHTLEEVNDVARRTAEDPDFNPYADETESQSSTPRDESSSSSGHPGGHHIDAVIDDTQEDRVDITRKILSEEI
ncbi:hypothetical protein [Halomicrobium katesii]|uniref:hypothetical protein n=1 Tax=Halomicrobium katesii TaxID=437163 RepID=UPI000366FB5D|nr:hypothetical protein [Halomicrobium katesii]